MKNLFVKDLKEGLSLFNEDFAVKSINAAKMKDGRTYYNVELADSTGTISGKIWPDSITKCDIKSEGKVVSVDAGIEKYRDSLQIKINSMIETTNFDAVNFMATSNFNPENLWQELEKYRNAIKNKYLRQLLTNCFTEETRASFINSAAGLTVHHEYKGGLVEHTVEMLRMSDSLKESYPKINKDLLISGIILHDIGKIFEYETGLTVKITTKGKLLGHISMGAKYVYDHCPEDMPEDLKNEITHIILSHHGSLEFGSPIKPKTAEALAISRFDVASANINSAYNMIQNLSDGNLFSNYHKQLGVELYKSPYLEDIVNEDIPF